MQAKKKEVAILYSQNKTDELITSLTEIHKQIYWIGKIKTLLEGDPLVRLGDLILTGESAAIRPEELKETILPALVEALFENKGFLELLGSPEILDKINKQELLNYLCFQGKRPQGLPTKESRKKPLKCPLQRTRKPPLLV